MEAADATLEVEFQDSLLQAPTRIPADGFDLEVDLTSLAQPVADLHAQIGEARTSFGAMMDTANRDRRGLCDAGGAHEPLAEVSSDVRGFCWNGGDSQAMYWYPQGITTTHDATISGRYQGRQVVANSWYHKPEFDPDNSGARETWINKGVRLSFTDWDANYPNKYRNVLLVEPVAGGDFTPVIIHAGGIAWYGNLLFVADVTRGMRIFDLRRIYRVDGGGSTLVGRQPDGTYHGFGYGYVMVQVGWVHSVGDPLRFSFLSLDRSTQPDSVLVGEYVALREDAPRGQVVRFPLDGQTSLPQVDGDGLGHGTEAYSAYHRMNGVLAHGSRFWFATIAPGGEAGEDGVPGHGRLVSWHRSNQSAAPLPWAMGPEDLSYWADAAAGDRVWTLTEYPGRRAVVSVPDTDLVPQAPAVGASVDPTPSPESDPGVDPSPEPTADPSGESDVDPSGEPGVDPSGEPGVDPSGEPGVDPTVAQPSGAGTQTGAETGTPAAGSGGSAPGGYPVESWVPGSP